MRQLLLLACCLCMSLSVFSQKKAAPMKLRHIGVYGGYNVNSIDNNALNRLTDLLNNSHAPNDVYFQYKDFLRMSGFSGGFMAWQGKFFADIGFNIRKTSQTARFKDIKNEFQRQELSMNSFHFGFGINMSDAKQKVVLSPGLSFGLGKLIIKEGVYRSEQDLIIPSTQRSPVGVLDDSKNMASVNMYGTAFVNITIGNMKKGPKLVIQPYMTLPVSQNDLTRAYYPVDVKVNDPALKARMNYWGIKVAVSL